MISCLSCNFAPHVGPHDIEAFFSADPTGFFIGELRGKKISHISAVKYPHMIHFALYVVDDKYRQRGFGMQTCRYAVEALGSKFQKESLLVVAIPEMKELYIRRRIWFLARMDQQGI